MKYQALKLYRELLAFHLDDSDPAALVDLDLDRLQFVYDHAVFEDKDKRFLHTLEQMEARYMGMEPVTEIYYQIARQYDNSGNKYDPGVSDDHRRDKIVAVQYCENAITEFPSSYGAALCKVLLKRLKEKKLDARIDYAGLPGKHILSSLAFMNVKDIYLRIVALDPEAHRKQKMNRDHEEMLSKYRSLRPIKHWPVTLPVDIDHQEHRTEIAIPPLTEGYYGLMISDNPAFDDKKGVVSLNQFWVTGLSYISNQKENGDLVLYILDRANGKRIPGVKLTAYEEMYRNREYMLTETGSYTSNNEGMVVIPAVEGKASRLIVEMQKGIDRFTSPGFFYVSGHAERPDRTVPVTYFFTDRSIYRPGQTVYFKGVMLERTGENHEILKNRSTRVKFHDVNGQLISELELKTNDYGSFNGVFTAPLGRLTGNMRILNESGSIAFSVEEYKRPRFEVVFDPVKGSYKLGSVVKVKGRAMAYAGSPVDHAMVKYRVVRNAYYPFNKYWRGYFPVSEEAEIAHGEVQTTEDGSFSIAFTAVPDAMRMKGYTPVFNYTVHVDITDISGETHSGEKTVSVSEKSLLIDLDMTEKVNRDEAGSFGIRTTNLNGAKEAAEVSVRIMQLQAPERIFNQRKWDKPDVYLITKEEFADIFPDIEYRDENDKSTWKEIRPVFERKINTGRDSVLKPEDLSRWATGAYKVEMSAKDVFGENVTSTHYFTLFSPKADKLPYPMAEWFVPLKQKGEPGEKAAFLIGSSYKDVSLLYELGGKEGVIRHEWLSLSGQQMLLEVPISEEDRGGMGLNLVFVHHNHGFQNAVTIEVPYTNKQLDISFESFRNKLLPGQEERWNIHIRSHKGEKVLAEMLAGMYDASLDAFRPHAWSFSLFEAFYSHDFWDAGNAFTTSSGNMFREYISYEWPSLRTYDQLYWKDKYGFGGGMARNLDGILLYKSSRSQEAESGILLADASAEEAGQSVASADERKPPPPPPGGGEKKDEAPIRKNLQETAFFFPDLRTNADGDVIISFTMPEALTRWKMMGFAYTQDLSSAIITRALVTQKELMILPNQPRFFREGDEIWFSARVVNMSGKALEGDASLQLFDAISMKPVDMAFGNDEQTVKFTASKGNSGHVSWKLQIPENAGPVLCRVTARAGNFSDGEETVIPVLRNRMLVTESMPLPVRGKESRDFRFEKLAASGEASGTLKHYTYTIEFTSNPAWYAVQALPYLMEYPYECSEQIFNRVYANSFAAHIVGKHPEIRNVFESWKTETPDALLSKLEKNQELKSVFLEETPWVMQARNESERKQRISLLFDLNRMNNELERSLGQLGQKQLGNGGWPWFDGGNDNRYITQYIISGFGKMQHLGVMPKNDPATREMVRNGIRYMDERMQEDFERIRKKYPDYREEDHLGQLQVQYLYARSFFNDEYLLLEKHKEAFMYFREQAKKYWRDRDKYMQGMIALALHRSGDKPVPALIMTSIREHALYDEEMGMYWRGDAGYYWHEAPVETQALLIEAFDEIMSDRASVELMKTWLLKNKQTHDWATTRATADACYALLLRGADLLAVEGDVSISVGGRAIDPEALDETKKEAGTGYFQYQWHGDAIDTGMANVSITKHDEGVAWGAVYWQYFEDLDKITPHASPLSISKKLFLKSYTDKGPVLIPVEDDDILRPGDMVVSRIEIRTDRDMEFVHMKDMRAAALEPVNSLSGYRWQGGLGYYESIRDASVNFFFSHLGRGTWVFEYPLYVTQEGSFSNGITSIQCMYAPEFAAHSEGVRIVVE